MTLRSVDIGIKRRVKISSNNTSAKTLRILSFLFSVIIFFTIPYVHADEVDDYREHQKQLVKIGNKFDEVDNNIHQYLTDLRSKKGVESLVLIYHFDQDVATFSTDVAALADEHFNSFSLHAGAMEKYAELNGFDPFDKNNLQAQYRASLAHLEEHIVWFTSSEVVTNMSKRQDAARHVLGTPDKDNLVDLHKSAENAFLSFAANSKAANAHQMWAVVQAIGVKQFSTETGIDLSKNSPEKQKQRYKERYAQLGETFDPIIFNALPEGVEYPHNYNYFKSEITYQSSGDDLSAVQESRKIVNRNLFSLHALVSENLQSEITQAISDYQATMDKFKTLAEVRFGIENWQDLPMPTENWLSLAQIWSIEQYQLMQRRFDAIQKMADPKADEDWFAMNKKLGFK
jgi:hypothetical protein